MTFVFHMLTGLLFIILQTVIFPGLPVLDTLFDLFVPMVVYLGLYRTIQESIPALLVYGLAMDSLSGTPFGVYLACYVWLFVIVFWFKGFLQIHSVTLLALIVFCGVLIENTVLVLTMEATSRQWHLFPKIMQQLLLQLVTATVFGPFVIIYIKRLYERADQAFSRLSDEY